MICILTYADIEAASHGIRGLVKMLCPIRQLKRGHPANGDTVLHVWITDQIASYRCERCKARGNIFRKKGERDV